MRAFSLSLSANGTSSHGGRSARAGYRDMVAVVVRVDVEYDLRKALTDAGS